VRDEHRIDLLSTETIRSTLDNVSVQLYARSVVVATVLGALAGATAGFKSTIIEMDQETRSYCFSVLPTSDGPVTDQMSIFPSFPRVVRARW
jgi:hypothetical protein